MSGLDRVSIPSSRLVAMNNYYKVEEDKIAPTTYGLVPPPPVPPMPSGVDTINYTYYRHEKMTVSDKAWDTGMSAVMFLTAGALNYYTRTAPDYNSKHNAANILGAIVGPAVLGTLGTLGIYHVIKGEKHRKVDPYTVSLNDPSISKVKKGSNTAGLAVLTSAGALLMGSAVTMFLLNESSFASGKRQFYPIAATFAGSMLVGGAMTGAGLSELGVPGSPSF